MRVDMYRRTYYFTSERCCWGTIGMNICRYLVRASLYYVCLCEENPKAWEGRREVGREGKEWGWSDRSPCSELCTCTENCKPGNSTRSGGKATIRAALALWSPGAAIRNDRQSVTHTCTGFPQQVPRNPMAKCHTSLVCYLANTLWPCCSAWWGLSGKRGANLEHNLRTTTHAQQLNPELLQNKHSFFSRSVELMSCNCSCLDHSYMHWVGSMNPGAAMTKSMQTVCGM